MKNKIIAVDFDGTLCKKQVAGNRRSKQRDDYISERPAGEWIQAHPLDMSGGRYAEKCN